MSVNRYCLFILMTNGICRPENRKGSGYGITFRGGDAYNQYICSECCTINDDEETADVQPYALDDRIFNRKFIEDSNASAKFSHLVNPEVINSANGLFGEVMQHVYGETMERDRKLNELMQAAQKREEEIIKAAEYTFYGHTLSRMTGLEEDDMEELIESIKPFKRSFGKITLREAITLFFHYAR